MAAKSINAPMWVYGFTRFTGFDHLWERVRRRLPVTIPVSGLHKSRMGRYHLSDPYFRFYFRFLAPFHDTLTFDPDRILAQVKEGLRAFVGQTAFEEISREWVVRQGKKGQLPFEPEVVGSHWSASVQAHVVAINWHERQILVGECKWASERIDRQIVREMIEKKTPKVMQSLPAGECTTSSFLVAE